MVWKRMGLLVMSLIGAASLHAANVDSTPYDSIANPFASITNDFEMQRKADLNNLVPNRLRVNQAGYRSVDVQEGRANFYYVASGAPGTVSVYNMLGVKAVPDLIPLKSKGASVDGQVNPYASNSAEHKANGIGDWRIGYPMTGTIVSGTLYEGFLPKTLPDGRYYLKIGSDTSVSFVVSANVYGMVRDAAMKFFGIQRSGEGSSWFHASSHTWDGWLYDSSAKDTKGKYVYKGALSGGWYDCGDHLKETRTQSFAMAMLGVTAATMPGKDPDHYAFNQAQTKKTDGIPDQVRELKWGAEFAIKAFNLAGGKVEKKKLFLSVGDFGKDHGWWGRPENQDAVTANGRGGRNERVVRDDWGSGSLGDWAAGLAFVSRLYRPYDKTKWCDTALMVAKAFYEGAKATNSLETTPAYNGESKTSDDMGLAAVALLWATGDKTYLDELVYKKGMPDGKGTTCGATQESFFPAYDFAGGLMGCGPDNMTRGGTNGAANTDWGSIQVPTLYSFLKLILADADTASLRYGISAKERGILTERAINNLMANINGNQKAGLRIELPTSSNSRFGNGNPPIVGADSLWYSMHTQQDWVWNRYQMGNLADLYMYWDVTRDLDPSKVALPNTPNPNWKRDDVLKVLTSGMNVILGMNRVDLSMLFGVGTKNPNHPHHRAANPEGRNTAGALYPYRVPVGALYGGKNPAGATGAGTMDDQWWNYFQTETCLDAAAVTILPVTGLAENIPDVAPKPTVKVLYTTDTLAAIQVDLDKWGYVSINYGLDSSLASMTARTDGKDTSNTATIYIHPVKAATQYYFSVTVTDLSGHTRTVRAWPKSADDSIPFSFLTKAKPAPAPLYGNIKVCNVTADTAEIMWYTPNGEYLSSVQYADSANWKMKVFSRVDTDLVGNVPVKFHHVKIAGLKERTTYYFRVGVPGAYGADTGCFRTPVKDIKFQIFAGQYYWGTLPSLGINVVNMEEQSYDSLAVRVYMRSKDTLLDPKTGKPILYKKSTPTGLIDVPVRFDQALAARYDICQAYDEAGFNKPCDDPSYGLKWSWSDLNRGVQMMNPVKMPETYDAKSNTYVYYMDLPLGPTVMKSQSRIRFDVMFARRSEYSKTFSQGQMNDLNFVKTYVPNRPYQSVGDTGWYDALNDGLWEHSFLTTADATFSGNLDWSWQAHSMAAGAPMDFMGMQSKSKDSMDSTLDMSTINPYMAVYRKGTFIYGLSPSQIEQATKRTVYVMDMTFDAPFNELNGGTVDVTGATAPRLKGKANVYDQLMPGMKGYITSIWVNGTELSDAERKAALARQADGTWKVDLPLKLTGGTNKVDVTFFAGSDSTEKISVNNCDESKGCAFFNGSWYVNFASSLTPSVMTVTDAQGKDVSKVTPDSSVVTVRVNDGNANKNKTAVDVVNVSVTNTRTKLIQNLTLVETGASTGIFEITSSVVSGTAGANQIGITQGDTLSLLYRDADDSSDTSVVQLFSEPAWAIPLQAAVVLGCDGAYAVRVRFSKAITGMTSSAKVRLIAAGSDSLAPVTIDSTLFQINGNTFTMPLTGTTSGTSWSGSLQISVPNGRGGFVPTSISVDDSIGPRLLQASVYENFTVGAPDTVRLVFSEKPVFGSTAMPFVLQSNSGTFTLDSLWEDSAAVNRWKLIVHGGKLVAGVDSLKLVTLSAVVRDASGNAAADCDAWTPLKLFVRTPPVKSAWLKDLDGDGRADLLTVEFARALDPSKGEVVDSFVVAFGPGNTLKTAIPQASANQNVVTALIPNPFAVDMTMGTGVRGAGTLYVSIKGALDMSDGKPVEDSVGPNALSARLRYGNGKDTILIRVSEGARCLHLDANGSCQDVSDFVRKLDGSRLGDAVAFDGANAYVVIDTGKIVPNVDRIQLGASVSDALGNAPGASNPFVLVTGGDRPPTKAWYEDVDGDGTIDRVTLLLAPRKFHRVNNFVFSWPKSSGFLASASVKGSYADTGVDVVRYQITGFDSLLTGNGFSWLPADHMGLMIDAQTGDSTYFTVQDGAAPALVSAELKYNAVEGAADTLLLKFTENVSIGAGNVAVVGMLGNLVRFVGYERDLFDTSVVRLFVDATANSTQFHRGDSLATAGSEGTLTDLLGNQAGLLRRWVKLKFGARNPVFSVTVQNPVQTYTGWMDGVKTPTHPGMSMLVREPGGNWTRLDGENLELTQEEIEKQGMGVLVEINQGMSGYAYIYDNLGMFVAGIDLSKFKTAWDDGKVPTSASQRTQVWIYWDGRSNKGEMAASGVYTLRLVTDRGDKTKGKVNNDFLNKTYRLGWKRK